MTKQFTDEDAKELVAKVAKMPWGQITPQEAERWLTELLDQFLRVMAERDEALAKVREQSGMLHEVLSTHPDGYDVWLYNDKLQAMCPAPIPQEEVTDRSPLVVGFTTRIAELEAEVAAMSTELRIWNKSAEYPGGASQRIAENERLRQAFEKALEVDDDPPDGHCNACIHLLGLEDVMREAGK